MSSDVEQVRTVPVPLLEGLAGEFYSFCRGQRLSFQRCSECGRWRHIPRPRCDACSSGKWEWRESSGTGRIFSFTTVHRALNPGLQERVPFVCAVVEMDEGVRMVAEVDADAQGVVIGAQVEVCYVELSDDLALPRFRPSADGGAHGEAVLRER